MAAIYSTKFVDTNVSSPGGLQYTVPAGYVAVVRSISLAVTGSGVTAYVALGTAQVPVLGTFPSTGIALQSWYGRQVLDAGDTIHVAVSSSAVGVLISGYLLTAP